jgi:hypothetical protein
MYKLQELERERSRFAVPVQLQVTLQQQQQLLLQVVVVSNSCWKPSTVLLLKLKGFGLVHKGEPRVL